MKKFTFLFLTVNAIISIFMWVLNKILTILYLLLPIGLFMLIMQLRDKNNKANAIGTFLEDNSEFQFVFSDYMLVANKPNELKTKTKKRLNNLNNFLDKWKWLFIVSILVVTCVIIILGVVFN